MNDATNILREQREIAYQISIRQDIEREQQEELRKKQEEEKRRQMKKNK